MGRGLTAALEAASSPAQRRKRARQVEWALQTELAARLGELLPSDVFWTAVDNQPWSKVAGIRRKRRGCRAGLPDLLLLHDGATTGIELKSRVGRVSRAQRVIAREIAAAGGSWFLCRPVRSALVALHRSGVRLRDHGGRLWRPPVLPAWENPVSVSDLDQRMVWHPDVKRRWREDRRRQRAHQRALREAAATEGAEPASDAA